MSFNKNKLGRKMTKYANILYKEHNIKVAESPTKVLMVCNVGLALRVDVQDIVVFFSAYGVIESAVILPRKSYCFIAFKEFESAQACYDTVNGKLALDKGRLVYLLYSESIPKIEDNSCTLTQMPPGCELYENFVTEDEEKSFIAIVEKALENQSNSLKKRKVIHYGYEFIYGKNTIDKENPMSVKLPTECDILTDRLASFGYNLTEKPDQLTVNHYLPGIPPHIDTHSAFEDPILVVSLGSAIVMEFQKEDQQLSLLLPRRSMMVLSGESRYCWSHKISSRKSDVIQDPKDGLIVKQRSTRISFTFRKILMGECNCIYPSFCDSQINKLLTTDKAVDLEKKFVHEVYEEISGHFSLTRHKPWPRVLNFVNSLAPSSFLLDVGCGNGKYLKQNQNIFEIGCDYSNELLKICKEKNIETLRSDCLYLPFKDNLFDAVISIAVIHHLSTLDRRKKAVKEIVRVLKPGCKALVYVWARDQKFNNVKSTYLKSDDQIESIVHVNRTDFQKDKQDLFVPWKLASKETHTPVLLRYYHVFEENELEELCKDICNVENFYYDDGNWCAVIVK